MAHPYHNRKIIVVGAARSGLALCAYFLERGARVTLSDRRSREQCADQLADLDGRIDLDLGQHTADLFIAADLIAVSPGVPLEIPAIAAAKAAGVPILGEVEIAFRELTAPVIGITGTNGKSTTTALLGDLFQAWGKATFVGGNYGTPLIEAVGRKDWEWLVVELSSFQLEAIENFRPRWALLLNLSEDHLDRYPDMAAYCAAKQRIFACQRASDYAVINLDDEVCRDLAADTESRMIGFSASTVPAEGMGFDGRHIVWNWQGASVRFDSRELQLKGLHNTENVMAALIPALVEGCPADLAWRTVCGFTGLPHRMELVRRLDGVAWYNDSKGTNVGSVVKSLAGLDAPVTLIAGGKDKGGDYRVLREQVRAKVAELILIGEAAEKIAAELGDCSRVHRATTLEEAVTIARRLTPAGGAVLLSPGCSSYDMFLNYEQRGAYFAAAVRALPEGQEG